MKVKVDQNVCVGSGGCAKSCPEVFKMDGDKATVHVDTVPKELEEKCHSIKDGCPSGAISIED